MADGYLLLLPVCCGPNPINTFQPNFDTLIFKKSGWLFKNNASNNDLYEQSVIICWNFSFLNQAPDLFFQYFMITENVVKMFCSTGPGLLYDGLLVKRHQAKRNGGGELRSESGSRFRHFRLSFLHHSLWKKSEWQITGCCCYCAVHENSSSGRKLKIPPHTLRKNQLWFHSTWFLFRSISKSFIFDVKVCRGRRRMIVLWVCELLD